MDMDFIRSRITSLRLQKNISERELSLGIGKAQNYIYSITSGKINPTIESIFDICDYLEITPSEFFDNENADPALDREILNELKRLSDKDMPAYLEALKVMETKHFKALLDFLIKYKMTYRSDKKG